ncbi:hypothetical protein BDZ89DRAFT_1076801 [Hymenopellis radicata]|nr:hypothetical protein BDZ89DRAFT_1076801 [Hymenopellis radicata]
MLFKVSFVAAAAVALLPSVFGVAITARAKIDDATCISNGKYVGYYQDQFDQSCINLVRSCINTLKTDNSTDLWSVPTCVAGLTCDGSNLLVLAQCQNPEVSVTGAPHLNYDIYASIVGDCAWQEGGCPITFQNYVDFFYGQLTAIGSDSWPSSVDNVQEKWWTPIVDWTATGETIPYTNFDDWLHYAFTGTS